MQNNPASKELHVMSSVSPFSKYCDGIQLADDVSYESVVV